ncbi:MAG: ABC transporter substrate-binding protein [Aquificae bacterium]|nr:ABC transporter substrate-binding protein [Aquificota bacterium]
MKIRIAHSPDSDDAFMFYPLVQGEIDTEGLEIEHVLADIETLNREALKGTYEVSAISFHAYPYVADKYLVLPSGGSVGEGYGPVVVAREPLSTLKGKRIAVPGTLTTAFLTLKLYEPDFEHVVVPFDKIIDEVLEGNVDAGLVIHEGQLTYADHGLTKIVDLGEWWKKKYDLPLPLGCNIVRKDLGSEVIRKIERLMRKSIEYSLREREKALSYAIDYARDLQEDRQRTDKFVGMYVNHRTVDYGEDGREAVRLLLRLGREKGIIKVPIPKVIFSDEAQID